MQEESREAQLPPQERVQAVRPFWETLTQEQRVQLLSLSIEELRAKAADVTARLKRLSGVCHVLTDSKEMPACQSKLLAPADTSASPPWVSSVLTAWFVC